MTECAQDIFKIDSLSVNNESLSANDFSFELEDNHESNTCFKDHGEHISSEEKNLLNVRGSETNSPNFFSSANTKNKPANKCKAEENVISKSEKRRNNSLTKNEPPPLIHYLQEKDLPKVDDDNSPPQLLPEVIVTRTKIHKEKAQSTGEEIPFKISTNKSLKKLKRKSWLSCSYGSNLSDDQASSESHEYLLFTDTSQSSSSASGFKKRLKHCDKVQKMGTSPVTMRTLPKNIYNYGNGSFSFDNEEHSFDIEKRSEELKLDNDESYKINYADKESLFDMKSDIDFESWMTETEEEDEDIFVTPQRVSTGKEERDTIDGIEFLGFETEHDMVEFTKIELDFQGGALQEESVIHSDDGLDMMDDAYNYSESETQTTSQAIIPTKTKDITKIKGWRTKNFAINNNPSDGQCSSSSIGPSEDDDGFASCDIKIEEDASLDMEEHGDLSSGGEQDLFNHDKQFSGEQYALDDSLKKIDDTFVQEFHMKPEKKETENTSLHSVSFENDHADKQSIEYIENNVPEDLNTWTGRYPKRKSVMSKTFNTNANKSDSDSKFSPESQTKVPKKRGRKPKTIAEKRLMLQLANQYKRKRKRGRPKGSKNKNYQVFKHYESENGYNLRNSSRRESQEGSFTESSKTFDENKQCVNKIKIKKELHEHFQSEEHLLKTSNESISSESSKTSEYLSPVKIKEEPIDFEHSSVTEPTKIDGEYTNIVSTFENFEPSVLNSNGTTTQTTNSDPITATTSIAKTICSSVSSNIPNSSTCVPLPDSIPMPTIPIGKTHVTSSASVATSLITSNNNNNNSSLPIGTILENNTMKGIRNKTCNDNMVSLVNPSDKAFEYGLVLSTGIGRPVVALALEQLKMLRKNNTNIDEHWARFSASVVTTHDNAETNTTNTIILPIRAQSVPFTSFSSKNCNSVQRVSTTNKTPQLPEQKFAPMFGPSVRFRCPRPVSQVGVRILPSVSRRKSINRIPPFYNMSEVRLENKVQEPSNLSIIGKLNQRRNKGQLLSYQYDCDAIDDEIKKVVDDIVRYVERSEANDLLILEDPDYIPSGKDSALIRGNSVGRKKKAPMIRELSRLDVNVIEMWDAKNKECTEEFCKLGCVCESLECCRPAIEEHCGKEECMFKCECEPQSYRRGENRQHSLLSPLSLLNIPQQNRRVLAKEEKEFQQTVIRAKHETIVVGSSGNCRRKREIKLPGRYRDSYVALGKEYGLVDFKISSDEATESPPKKHARMSLVNTKDNVSVTVQKNSPTQPKVLWETKLIELKNKFHIKECSIKLEQNCTFQFEHSNSKQDTNVNNFPVDSNIAKENNKAKISILKPIVKSRNMAVKSTTPRPSNWFDITCNSARTTPVNIHLLRKLKNNSMENYYKSPSTEIDLASSINTNEDPLPENILNPFEATTSNSVASELLIDNSSEGFGKIESVTTLSVEQFQRGDLGFGLEPMKNENEEATVISQETSSVLNTSPDKSARGKTNSCNLTVNKIADLLNRRIRELKETGGSVSFPSPGNEESIHLLPWPVLKSLFQAKEIQLWFYKGGSKLIITSTKQCPDSSFVNLNDISPFDYKQLPSIITDLLKNSGQCKRLNNPDVYALLHFDGNNVELVGTIYKNQSLSHNKNNLKNHITKGFELKNKSSKYGLDVNAEEYKSITNVSPITFPAFDLKNIISHSNLVQTLGTTGSSNIKMNPSVPASLINKSHPELTITEIKEKCKSNDHVFIAPESENKPYSDNVSCVRKPDTDFTKHKIESASSKKVIPSSVKGTDTFLTKTSVPCTKVRKFKTVLQSTKVETASGENVPVPLPTCALDSRWYVLCMDKAFDVLQVNKKCTVRHRHIVESIKMALKHCKTVRLPLQVPKEDQKHPYQPKFGVYAVPCISSFVFVGPFSLHENCIISMCLIQDGKLVNRNDFDGPESINSVPKVPQERNSSHSIVDILKKLWYSSKSDESQEPWLFTKKSLAVQSKQVSLIKEPLGNEKSLGSGKDGIKSSSKNLEDIQISENLVKKKVSEDIVCESEISIIKSVSSDMAKETVSIQEDNNVSRKEPNPPPTLSLNSSSLLSGGSVKCNEPKKKTETNEGLSSEITSSPSRKFKKKQSLATVMKSAVKPTSSKMSQPVPVSGWLVPSYSWIGCMQCNFNGDGGLFFSHPVSGVKMIFSNLESAQLWLDRLFQSAILYIPRQLFIIWTLKLDSGDNGIQLFDPTVLNGDYIMTAKGVFDIDKLVPTDADMYGLKPIEILRLQDKKRRRDLELGFFQLGRALQEIGFQKGSNKIDTVRKAISAISDLEIKTKQLERERKRWRSTKHKSLLHLYNMMKDKKKNIVQKLKSQYDQADAADKVPTNEPDLHDGLTYSMSRYCGNAFIFGSACNESDIDNYLSECNDEMDDSLDEPHKLSVKKEPAKRNNISDMHQDDDESVSISVVNASSQNINDEQANNNSDEVIVTCLSEQDNSRKLVEPSILKQVASLQDAKFKKKFANDKVSGALTIRTPPKVSNSVLSSSSEKVTISANIRNVLESSTAVKRKLFESSTSSVLEDVSKKFKTDHVQVTPLGTPNLKEKNNVNSCFDGRFVKQYVKLDSPVHGSDLANVNSSVPVTETRSSALRNNKAGLLGSHVTTVPTSNTLFVNVISSNQSKLVPLHVEKPKSSQGYLPSTIHLPTTGTVPIPNTSLKLLKNVKGKQTLTKVQKDSFPILVSNPSKSLSPSKVQAKSGILTQAKVDSPRPLISVKSFAKDTSAPNRESANFLPTLVPIVDGKLKLQIPCDKTNQNRYKAIAPMPTLIPIVDGIPAEVGNKKT